MISLLKIGSTDLTSYLTEYTVSYQDMWTEAGRNLAGNLKATFVGTVPKISLTFRQLTKSEANTIAGLLNGHSFSVTWYDIQTQTTKTGTFYRGDYGISIRDLTSERYKEFSVNLIAFNKI